MIGTAQSSMVSTAEPSMISTEKVLKQTDFDRPVLFLFSNYSVKMFLKKLEKLNSKSRSSYQPLSFKSFA